MNLATAAELSILTLRVRLGTTPTLGFTEQVVLKGVLKLVTLIPSRVSLYFTSFLTP